MDNLTKEKLEKTKKVIYVTEIMYLGKSYAQTMKIKKDGIEYVYYDIDGEDIKEIQDEAIIEHFKEKFEGHNTDIIY
ncbi:MAG: hypothetical protein HFJ24_02525 [Clostridia bacterium]|nr:hypothetical protein [Clostridia bacterium]MCI9274914.1 hypothetical protein [Clostridia bacterium]